MIPSLFGNIFSGNSPVPPAEVLDFVTGNFSSSDNYIYIY